MFDKWCIGIYNVVSFGLLEVKGCYSIGMSKCKVRGFLKNDGN